MKKEYEQPDWNKFKQGVKSTLMEALSFGMLMFLVFGIFTVILKTLF